MAEQFKFNFSFFSFCVEEYFLKMINFKLAQQIFKLSHIIYRGVMAYGYYHFLTEYLYDVAVCQGFSMEPTLCNKDLILITKINKYSVKKGDIVVLRNPSCPTRFVCKRIMHTAGEIIESPKFSGKIPRGSIWLEGDNLFRSTDSRDYGPVPKGLILGKAICVLWPLVRDLRGH